METARCVAEATNEIQNPPHVHAYQPFYVCRSCHPNERGESKVKLGAAVEVWPREKFRLLREELEKPHADRDYERWHR
ncbi:MAG: hypothetical protein ACRCYU_04770 [Nocardioides sp.]